MQTRFPALAQLLVGQPLRLSERERLRAQLQEARAKHRPTNHILKRLRILTTGELARSSCA